MGLNIDLSQLPKAKGGFPPKVLNAEYLRPLTRDDLVLVWQREEGSTFQPLKTIRAAHHRLAILLAEGKSNTDVGRITGYSPGRISELKRDPAFRALLDHYTRMGETALADVLGQLNSLGQAAIQELQSRIETTPEEFTVEGLTKLLEKIMDRTGHGPVTTTRVLNSSDVIKELVAQRQAEVVGKVISVEDAE